MIEFYSDQRNILEVFCSRQVCIAMVRTKVALSTTRPKGPGLFCRPAVLIYAYLLQKVLWIYIGEVNIEVY